MCPPPPTESIFWIVNSSLKNIIHPLIFFYFCSLYSQRCRGKIGQEKRLEKKKGKKRKEWKKGKLDLKSRSLSIWLNEDWNGLTLKINSTGKKKKISGTRIIFKNHFILIFPWMEWLIFYIYIKKKSDKLFIFLWHHTKCFLSAGKNWT